MSTILAVDTASPRFALALAVDGQLAASVERDAAQDHSKLLLAAVDEILGGRRGDLAGIVVVQGPGSYAGLRVGLATAQGLSLALAIPVRGMSTLEAVARGTGLSDFTAIHPAGRGDFAAQRFRDGSAAGPLGSATRADLAGLVLAGEGAGELGGCEVRPEERCRAALASLVPAFAASAPTHEVEALYLREPSITLPRRRSAAPTIS